MYAPVCNHFTPAALSRMKNTQLSSILCQCTFNEMQSGVYSSKKLYAGKLAWCQSGLATSVHIINESIICHTRARPVGEERRDVEVEGERGAKVWAPGGATAFSHSLCPRLSHTCFIHKLSGLCVKSLYR